MDNDTPKPSEAVNPVDDAATGNPTLFDAGPIHLQPTGEDVLFEGGAVGGLHIGPNRDRLPGADPLYDGSLEARLRKSAP